VHAPALWRILGPEAFALFPETRAVLAALVAEGYPIVLVSNWQRGLGHFVVELDLADEFDHVISSAELGVAKPDARIFEEACGRLGAPADRVLHVGDTLTDDYEGSREAGLNALLLHRRPDPPPDGVDAIADLRELLSWLSTP
jgi:putative hydrolase of the HAD superfamily